MANKYYDKIMTLDGIDDFKKIVEKWSNLSSNITKYPTPAPVLLPDMLWVASSGAGKTNLLRLMSEFLYSQGNLMDFYGDVKFFEFYMEYCPPRSPFTEIRRLIDNVSDAAGFRNEYKGIIYIDVSEWVNHFEEKHFISFMEYIAANSKNWLIVLAVNPVDEVSIKNFEAFVSMYLRIEKVVLTVPEAESLALYAENLLKDYDLTLVADAKEVLINSINELRKNKYFDGYKTVIMLCQDIIYSVFSRPTNRTTLLNAQDIAEFSQESEYIKKTVKNIEKVRLIGLTERGEQQ